MLYFHTVNAGFVFHFRFIVLLFFSLLLIEIVGFCGLFLQY